MTTTTRQNNLILAEDWTRIYQTFKNADFKSYDFENLRRVMVAYIKENYPEDFNDFIESSESDDSPVSSVSSVKLFSFIN